MDKTTASGLHYSSDEHFDKATRYDAPGTPIGFSERLVPRFKQGATPPSHPVNSMPLVDDIVGQINGLNENLSAFASRLSVIVDRLFGVMPETGAAGGKTCPPVNGSLDALGQSLNRSSGNVVEISHLIERLERL